MSWRISDHDRGRCSVVDLEGELDLYTAPLLRAHLSGLVAGGRTHLVLDLHQLDFMDSVGLGAIVDGLKRVRATGGTMQLVCTDEAILRVIRTTGLTALVEVRASQEQAVADCG